MEHIKINEVDAKNCKAISEFIAVFNGKCAHITGANGVGKSTIIRVLIDRIKGLKPSIVTKIGEKEGHYIMHLTDGCRFEWKFNDQGRDELNYFTPDTFKPVRRDVFKAICQQYFPSQFDINVFLTTTEPAKRLKMISELVQVDLEEVQAKYKLSFDIRRDAKKELQILENQIKPKPESQNFDDLNSDAEQKEVETIELNIKGKKESIETERLTLNNQYIENKKVADDSDNTHNSDYQKKLDEWLASEEARTKKVTNWNKNQNEKSQLIEFNRQLLFNTLHEIESTFLNEFFDTKGANKFIHELPQPDKLLIFDSTPKPEFIKLVHKNIMPSDANLLDFKRDLTSFEEDLGNAKNTLELKKNELSDLNASKQVYDLQLKQYTDFQADIKKQYDAVQDCESDVAEILSEIKTIISATKLPEEFQIDLTNKNDILFRTSPDAEYLPITNETLASSAIFIAAFKLQANYLEAFRVSHFDVSYLDYENREKVLKEAIAMNIQLITESPAHDEKSRELQYKLTEE